MHAQPVGDDGIDGVDGFVDPPAGRHDGLQMLGLVQGGAVQTILTIKFLDYINMSLGRTAAYQNNYLSRTFGDDAAPDCSVHALLAWPGLGGLFQTEVRFDRPKGAAP
jgi:hypothetical protein